MEETRITVYAALVANIVVAAVKAAAGVLSGSNAMLAEAAHSVGDGANQGLLRLSLSLAEREPDREHPFGHGRERYFWSLLAAIFIFVAGAIFSWARGIMAMLSPGKGEAGFVLNYIVLAVALVAESVSMGRALWQTRGSSQEAGKPFLRYLRESRDPTIKTVVLEDVAGVAGIVVALVGVGLHQLTGASRYDAAGSILIGVLLAGVAFTIGRDARHQLLGAAARPEEQQAIADAIRSHPAIEDLVELRTMTLHPTSLLVAARVDFADDLDANEIEEAAGEIDGAVRRAAPEVHEVFIDPTPRDDGRVRSRSRRTARR